MKKQTKQTIIYSVTFSGAVLGFCGILSGLSGIEFGTYGIFEGLVRTAISALAMAALGFLSSEMDKRMRAEARRRRKEADAVTERIDVTLINRQIENKPIRKVVM
mgnify:FL=1